VWVMLHSGSRGIGNSIGSFFIEKAKEEMERWYINLPNQDLAYIPEGSTYFKDYVEAVEWAQEYAAESRKLMLMATLRAMRESGLPEFAVEGQIVNCHHNYISRENHLGENLIVTRKGAVSAREGQWASSRARWARAATSCAARATGRADVVLPRRRPRDVAHRGAPPVHGRGPHQSDRGRRVPEGRVVIDETPAAYKDIDAVMAAQETLVEPGLHAEAGLVREGRRQGREADALLSALALQTMRQTPTEEQPAGEVEARDPLAAVAGGMDQRLVTTEYTREAAMNLLTHYLGAKLDGDDVLNDEGVKLYLADNLGTLISSLDGTEEYVASLKANAKHPRFYFREGLPRAQHYLETAEGLLKRFPWRYAADTPREAIVDLRKAQGFIQYAITAITGRGPAETPPKIEANGRVTGDQYDEDGLIPYNPPGAPTIRPLEEMISTAERVVRVLKAFKEKRDEGMEAALKRAPNELRKVVAEEVEKLSLADLTEKLFPEGPHPLAPEERNLGIEENAAPIEFVTTPPTMGGEGK
jgi:hypothetical protein